MARTPRQTDPDATPKTRRPRLSANLREARRELRQLSIDIALMGNLELADELEQVAEQAFTNRDYTVLVDAARRLREARS